VTAPEKAEAALQYKQMANKTIKKLQKTAKKVRRNVGKMAGGAMGAAILDQKAMAAAKMLEDPCNATISEACYRGDLGFRNRFVASVTLLNGAGVTAGAIAFIPGPNIVYWMAAANSTTGVTWTSFNGPGTNFIQTNAVAIRSLGACISSTPVAPNLSTSGQVYTSIVPVSALAVGSTQTPDQLSQLCNKYGKVVIDQPMETKWIPGSADENYNTPFVTADSSDQTAILMVYVGLPAASGIISRFTNITEWKPLNSLGIASESFHGNPSRNTIEHVKQALARKNPNWWSNIGTLAYSVIRGYATAGMVGAVGAAFKATKFL